MRYGVGTLLCPGGRGRGSLSMPNSIGALNSEGRKREKKGEGHRGILGVWRAPREKKGGFPLLRDSVKKKKKGKGWGRLPILISVRGGEGENFIVAGNTPKEKKKGQNVGCSPPKEYH